jgi:hypothetical protein
MEAKELETQEAAGTAVAIVEDPRRHVRMLRPVAEPASIIAVQEETRELIQKALKEGRDYGKIPGVDKPTLLKPGAERTILAFGCYARFTIVEHEVDHDREVRWVKRKKQWKNRFHGDREFDWIDESGVSLGLYRYVVLCEIVERASGSVVGSFAGSCSSMESKYIDRPRDSENTILKMAEKRGLVGAALVTFALSDQFTQDVEDTAPAEPGKPDAEPEPPITRDSQISWGKSNGTAIKDLPDGYLTWAIEPGRKFGADTEKWQAAMREEVKRREQEKADAAADAAADAEDASADDLPF